MAESPSMITRCTAKQNPFSMQKMERNRFRFIDGDWASNLARLESMSFRGAVVGPQGSGKTTLLLELRKKLETTGQTTGCLFLPQQRDEQKVLIDSLIEKSPRETILIVDGIERLTGSRRKQLIRDSLDFAGLIVAIHRPGFLPTWLNTSTTKDLMHQLLKSLSLEDEITKSLAEKLFDKYRGNLRDVFREMYDLFASRKI